MKTVNKLDVKRTVKRLFEEGKVIQSDMADALGYGESYLSRQLSPNDELDGFLYGYLRPLGYLADKHPDVLNNVDTYVQNIINGWRVPTHKLHEAQSADLYVLEISALAAQLWEAQMRRKPESEIKVITAKLSGKVIEFQRSMERTTELIEMPG